jgi:hypothetical protein
VSSLIGVCCGAFGALAEKASPDGTPPVILVVPNCDINPTPLAEAVYCPSGTVVSDTIPVAAGAVIVHQAGSRWRGAL